MHLVRALELEWWWIDLAGFILVVTIWNSLSFKWKFFLTRRSREIVFSKSLASWEFVLLCFVLWELLLFFFVGGGRGCLLCHFFSLSKLDHSESKQEIRSGIVYTKLIDVIVYILEKSTKQLQSWNLILTKGLVLWTFESSFVHNLLHEEQLLSIQARVQIQSF